MCASTQDSQIRGNISPQETEPQQLTQHLHEPVVEKESRVKMLLFLHRHHCFLRRLLVAIVAEGYHRAPTQSLRLLNVDEDALFVQRPRRVTRILTHLAT